MKPSIHWLGTGLSSPPGIRRLAATTHPLIVWNRTPEKARLALPDISDGIPIRKLSLENLAACVHPGDVVVSMLPAGMHPSVVELCLDQRTHFVCSSYVAPAIATLDTEAKEKGLCLVNEVGLDPGLDHLMAHSLIHAYRKSPLFAPDKQHFFRSYCGGFPAEANAFRYKFSWSPLGVLKALRSPAQWLAGGAIRTCQAPWEALSTYTAAFAKGRESFQAYPNRDSLPFMSYYGMTREWDVQEFVRGTLRLPGWSEAWQPIFDAIVPLKGEDGARRLVEISEALEEKYSYEDQEADRVVLCVELEVRQNEKPVWHQAYHLDSKGNPRGQAMARLVSLPVSLAVEAVLDKEIPAGVTAAPSEPEQVTHWLDQLERLGEACSLHDYLA
ncbi:saccharopine dehydrogenase NADP-binding domain-containing protein [bacterium]|nr:saccharopine dehydrogenase NADP-binding domain-containing protein [bacterium]MDG1891129.1 saccharopine dehydrogenase NADP-binding domain-containing protein [Verrucomicrobiota bacterium]